MSLRVAAVACVLTLHAPDGSELLILSDAIRAIRPINARHHDHVAQGIHSVLYIGVTPNGFGVTETAPEILEMMNCQGSHV